MTQMVILNETKWSEESHIKRLDPSPVAQDDISV